MRVKKAIFPVAGLGTRFLPATKATPKEMLPIVDKPLIQYAVEEAIAAGITEMIFVTSSEKRAIEDHFDRNQQLEERLAKAGKEKLLDAVKSILPNNIHCAYVRQSEQLGLGHAVLCAEPFINNEPFAVLLADDLMAQKSCLKNMVDEYQQHNASIIAVQRIAKDKTDQYGIVELQDNDFNKAIQNIVEKPNPENAPSDCGVIGRYILTPQIFTELKSAKPGVGNEIQLTDAIAKMMHKESVYAYEIEGKRYDCGSKLGYLQATVEYGLQHPELAAHFSNYLKALNIEHGDKLKS